MYIKPLIIDADDLSEGIFAASGTNGSAAAGCYTTSAYIHQTPQMGRGDYRIQVNAQHHADHTKDTQYLSISFNQNVILKSCPGSLINGTGTNTLTIQLNYHQNPNDNIGFGDLIVEADPGLEITAVSMTD